MVNYNGTLYKKETVFLPHANRGLRYGDALFETLRVLQGKPCFWEDHYFRLMASMRILRMEIPLHFTMEFLEQEILKTLESTLPARIRLTVFRKEGGYYTPATNEVSYLIEASPLPAPFYILEEEEYEIELYKDFTLPADLLSTLKSANKITHVLGSIYARENGLQNCLLLNQQKQLVEALNANLFLVSGNTIKTPPLEDGCLNGIIRKKLLEMLPKIPEYKLIVASITPFELQKADELFLTNSILGIRPVTRYRKTAYGNTVARELLGKLNALARLN